MDNKKSFFDKVGGTLRLGGKAKYKNTPSTYNNRQLPFEEHGFNSMDSYSASSDFMSMSPGHVKEKFEKLLDDMNLTDEKKAPLRDKDIYFKRHMLAMQARGSSKARGGELETPHAFVHELMNPDLKGQRRMQVLETLKVSLTSKPVSWVMEFGQNGLNAILRNLNYCCDTSQDRRSTYECVRCLKAFMNNTFGLKRILEHEEALTILSRTLDPTDPPTMLEAVRCLAAICLVPPDGHDRVLGGISEAGEIDDHERFLPIICGLRMRDNPSMQVACIQLVNAIVSTPDDLDFRMHLRNEFMRTGLNDIIRWLDSHEDEELKTHLHIFHEHKESDMEEFCHRYDNIRIEMEYPFDPRACFNLIFNSVTNTVAEPYFLSLLQHLLAIRDDMYSRPQYYKLIEECVTQIVLHRSGYDPDFRATKRFNIDVEPLLSNLSRSSKFEDGGSDKNLADMTIKLDTAITAKQEAEAKAISLEDKVQQYELELTQIKDGIKQNIGDSITKALIRSPGNVGNSNVPPPPPPPPPLPSIGGGPPPAPPLPGMSLHMPPGSVPPYPNTFQSPPSSQLPFGMAPKKKYSTNAQTKRLNWNKVNPKSLDKDSLWVYLQEERFEIPDILRGLEDMFSTKSLSKKEISEAADKRPVRKGKDLKVLDIKSGQNLSILLSSIKLPYEEIKNRLLAVDEKNLTPGILEQLIRSVPQPEDMKKLSQFKDCYSELAEPEQFVLVMSSIKGLVPRLNSILFKMKFPEMVADIKPDLVSATEALDEIKNSQKFARLLELLLLMGNYLNTGSRNAQSVGFDISFLTKLEGTKSQDGSLTLLHFLTQILENKYPDILGFLDETVHLDKAARVSPESIQKCINSMSKQLRDLELDLKTFKTTDPNDNFAHVMKNFLKEAQQQYELLSTMYKKLDALYESAAKYFAFDPRKYTMEEFFSDMKTFKDGLQKALKENAKMRETQEKIKRAQEVKEKSEKEKREKKLRQAAILNMTADENQEGVMDSLLQALKTGSAFSVSRDNGKRRTPRAAGADRRAQLARSQSRHNLSENTTAKEIIFEDSQNIDPNTRRDNVKNKGRRRPSRDEETEAEKLLKRLKAL